MEGSATVTGWKRRSSAVSFSINLVDLTNGECNYFVSKQPAWAAKVLVNGFETGVSSNCFNSDTNQISFVVE